MPKAGRTAASYRAAAHEAAKRGAWLRAARLTDLAAARIEKLAGTGSELYKRDVVALKRVANDLRRFAKFKGNPGKSNPRRNGKNFLVTFYMRGRRRYLAQRQFGGFTAKIREAQFFTEAEAVHQAGLIRGAQILKRVK